MLDEVRKVPLLELIARDLREIRPQSQKISQRVRRLLAVTDLPIDRARADTYYRVKEILTVTRTGTGTPFSKVGRYSHCRTASSAA